jgi:hypothetical protein
MAYRCLTNGGSGATSEIAAFPTFSGPSTSCRNYHPYSYSASGPCRDSLTSLSLSGVSQTVNVKGDEAGSEPKGGSQHSAAKPQPNSLMRVGMTSMTKIEDGEWRMAGAEPRTLNLELTGRGSWSRRVSCKKKTSAPANHVLNPFIEKHRNDVMGILLSFDRLGLQGSLITDFAAYRTYAYSVSRPKNVLSRFFRSAIRVWEGVVAGGEWWAGGVLERG